MMYAACGLLLCALVSSTVAQSAGDPACPCIDTTDLIQTNENCTYFAVNDVVSGDTSVHCYPNDYGSTYCSAHDSTLPPFCNGPSPPSFCAQSWCYVNASLCKTSRHSYTKTTFFPGEDLFFSFTTCGGDAASFTEFEAIAVTNRTIEVCVPVSEHAAHFKSYPNGTCVPYGGNTPEYLDDSIPFEGVIPEYLAYLQTLSGQGSNMHFKFTFKSQASSDKYPLSSYTACVADVEAGIADMAAGMFWITTERLRMTPFTSPLYIDEIVLWTTPEDIPEDSTADVMLAVFQPFSLSLWLLFLFAMVTVGILDTWFEPYDPDMEWKSYHSIFKLWGSAGLVERLGLLFIMMGQGLYVGAMGFFSGSVITISINDKLPGKLINFGWGFMVLITIAAYTANLAAFLTRDLVDGTGQWNSMDDVSRDGATVCALGALQSELESRWPAVNFYYGSNIEELVDGFNVNCTAIAMSLADVENSEKASQLFCEKSLKALSINVISQAIAFPVSKELAAGISYWMQRESSSGSAKLQQLQSNYAPVIPSDCSYKLDDSSDDDSDLKPITATNMILPFLMLGICAVVAAILKVLEKDEVKFDEKTNPYAKRSSNYEMNTTHQLSVVNPTAVESV